MPLYLYRRGKIWHYRGTVAGRRLRGSTKTAQKPEAERIANAVESRILKGDRDGPGAILTFSQAAIEYRKLGKVPRYLDLVEDYWKDRLVSTITRGAVKQAAVTLYPKASGATRNRSVIVPTLAVINHAADLELCAPLRMDWFPEVRGEPKVPATQAWVDAFMAHASPHLGALACFMYGTGARIGEAVALTWADVDLTARRASITQSKIGGDVRRAHLPLPVVAAMANIPGERDPAERVFLYARPDSTRDPWLKAVKRAGIEPLTPHCCRHGFATAMMRSGVDVKTVARLGGWKSAQHVLATYAHAMSDDTLTNRLFDTPQAQSSQDEHFPLQYQGRRKQV